MNCMYYKVDVAIKSYVISFLTGSTFDGFIDCTNEYQTKRVELWSWKVYFILVIWIEKNANFKKSINTTKARNVIKLVLMTLTTSRTNYKWVGHTGILRHFKLSIQGCPWVMWPNSFIRCNVFQKLLWLLTCFQGIILCWDKFLWPQNYDFSSCS